MKKFTLLVAAVLIAATSFARTIYFTPTAEWQADGAKFAIWQWGGTEANNTFTPFMALVAGETNIYQAEIADSSTYLIFARMSSGAATPDWGAKTNQSGNLTTPTDGTNHAIQPAEMDAWTAVTWETFTTDAPSLSIAAPAYIVLGNAITVVPTATNMNNPAITYEVKTDGAYAACTMPYTPDALGKYTFKATATEGETTIVSNELIVTVEGTPGPVTVRVLKPTDWTEAVQSIHYWHSAGSTSAPVAMTDAGEGWFEYTIADYAGGGIGVIFINGASWNGDANQTVDITGVTTSSCYMLTTGEGKATATEVNCPTIETSVENNQMVADIYSNNGELYVNCEGEATLRIFSVTGQMVQNTTINNSYTTALEQGVYVVFLNDKAVKVAIK